MKYSIFSLLAFIVLTTNSFAAPAKTESSGRVGIGFATYGGGDIGNAVTGKGIDPALSFWLDFNANHSLQLLGAIDSSKPFQFGFGSVYRVRAIGNRDSACFHAGLGFNLGTTPDPAAGATGSTMFANIFPLVGFDIAVGNNVAISFDGGPVFAVTPTFQFMLEPLSSTLLGFSIHYYL